MLWPAGDQQSENTLMAFRSVKRVGSPLLGCLQISGPPLWSETKINPPAKEKALGLSPWCCRPLGRRARRRCARRKGWIFSRRPRLPSGRSCPQTGDQTQAAQTQANGRRRPLEVNRPRAGIVARLLEKTRVRPPCGEGVALSRSINYIETRNIDPWIFTLQVFARRSE